MRTDQPILIVGAGLAGLTAATLLAWRNISCVLVERRPSTSRHPRARGVNLRTLELLHGVPGLVADLCAAAPVSPDFSIVIAESVTSPPIQTVVAPGDFDTRALSPSPMCTAGQDRLEPVLLRHAQALGADIRFATELVSFRQDVGGVTALLRDRNSGEDTSLSVPFMIAADGHRSPVRKALEIGVSGKGVLSNNMSIIFQADMRAITGGKGFLLCYLRNPKFSGTFVTTDDADIGQVSVEYDPAKESAADYTPDRCAEMVRGALGIPDLAVRILDVMPWEMSAQVADRMRQGAVFLAGDAAHTMPPTGGLGGQTAMQDAADLAWKLALVVRGEAGPALLDSYEAERHPVAALTVARQTANYVERLRPDRKDLAGKDDSDYIAVALGYRYRSGAIIRDGETGAIIRDGEASDGVCPDGGSRNLCIEDRGEMAENPFAQSGAPGTRLPHVMLHRQGEKLSSLDLVGRDFVLFAAYDGAGWMSAAQEACRALSVGMTVVQLGRDATDPLGAFAARTGIGRRGALLVRPDGFVAWRSRAAATEGGTILIEAISRILALDRVFSEDAA